MLSFDNLETIFNDAGKPCWTLYKGPTKGQQIGSYYPDVEDATPDMADSWTRLANLIEKYGDGIYTLECKSRRTTSKGNDQHTFLRGEMPGKVADKVGNFTPPAHPAASFFNGLDARYFMEQSNTLQQQLFALQMQLMQKEMELQRVRMEAKTKKEVITGTDRIMGLLEKNPQIINNALGVLAGQPVAIGTLKAQQPIPTAAPVGNFADEEDDDQGEGQDYTPGSIDLNALFLAAQQIQTALPDLHVNEILDRLADFCEANPEQARQALNMMS